MPPYGGRERGRGRRSVLAYPVVPSPDRLSDRTRWRSAGFWSADQRTVGRRLLPIDAVNEERGKSGVFDAGWRRTRQPKVGAAEQPSVWEPSRNQRLTKFRALYSAGAALSVNSLKIKVRQQTSS